MKKLEILLLAASLGMIFVIQLPGRVFAQEQKETVRIAVSEKYGSYLTGSDGRALYYFEKDQPGKSACSGSCTETWPVYCFTAEEIAVAPGLARSDFASFHRTDNDQDHLMYKGRPLYNYSGDKKAGDAAGHGNAGQWFLVRP